MNKLFLIPICALLFLQNVSAQVAGSPAPSEPAIFGPLVDRMKSQFATLEQLKSQGRYAEALTQSKSMLDEVRLKTGIDPKSKKIEIITSHADVYGSEYNALGKPLSEFKIITQNGIIDLVQKNKAGFYLDLLNLLKRTNLIYIESFQALLKQKPEGLLQSDRQKIMQDLLSVIVVPIYLLDSVQPQTPLLVFDSEVANDDQSYLFNRELKMYLIHNGSDLGFRSGDAQMLATQLDQMIAGRMAQVRQALSVSQGGKLNVNIFNSPNYKECLNDYKGLIPVSEVCTYKAEQYNFFNAEFKACRERHADESAIDATNACMTYAQ